MFTRDESLLKFLKTKHLFGGILNTCGKTNSKYFFNFMLSTQNYRSKLIYLEYYQWIFDDSQRASIRMSAQKWSFVNYKQ